MMQIHVKTATDISDRNLFITLINIAIYYFVKAKDIYRRPKGIGQMAYMHGDLIVRLSGAFYILITKLQGHGKSDLALFLFEKIVVRPVPFSKTAFEFCRCTKTHPVQPG